MEIAFQNPQPAQLRQQSEDESAKQLFDDLSMSEGNPFENLELSSQNQHSQQPQQNQNENNSDNEIDFRQMMRMSKKDKKKDKKLRKIKQAKERKQSKKENRNQNIKETEKSNHKPSKKMLLDSSQDQAKDQPKSSEESVNLKIKKSSKKVIKNSDDEEKMSSDRHDDSDEFSSQKEVSEDSELGKMDPNSGSGKKQYKKKLGRKSRKQRILEKQGFDLRELGNDASANYELNESVDESDDSFSDGGKRKKGNKRVKKDKKDKKPKLTNEQFLGKLQELGREDEADQNDSDKCNYDSGLNELQKLRPKKQSNNNKIKIQNKLFGNIQMNIEEENNDENAVQMPEEVLELQIKPKASTSSRASSFLNKVETLKKHRGLQADINQELFDQVTKQKAKRSISQLMSKIQDEIQDDEEIDIQIKAPTIAKGKSADLINNTMFIVKNLSQKQSSSAPSSENLITDATNAANHQGPNLAEKPQEPKAIKSQAVPIIQVKNKRGVSRSEFFKQIKETINVRKSKYISDDELKNSMKASNLEELEEIRKKIEEKRKKDAMYEMGELEDDADNVINELEADLARQKGISPAEFKKLIQMEEGLDVLEDYQEAEEKKKQRKEAEEGKEPKVAFELTLQQNVVPNIQNSQNEKVLTEQELKMKKILEIRKELKIRQAMAMQGEEIEEQSERHADDMVEDYEVSQLKPEEEMDLENQGDDQGDENDEDFDEDGIKNEDQNEQDSAQNNDQAKEQDEPESLSNKVGIEAEVKDGKNPELRKQLQEEGIIMPGNRKKAQLSQNYEPELDFSKYLAQNQNGEIIVPEIVEPVHNLQKTNEETLEFKEFRKLRKIAVVLQQKKKKREEQLKRAKEFFEQEAQLGSDNQENDDNVKAINKKDDQEEQDGDDLDQQLEELIDNAVDINEADEQEAFKRYMEDVKQKDREELQRILRGDFRRPNQDMPEMQEMQEDERNRLQRMERMFERLKQRQESEMDMYAKDESEDSDDEMNYYFDKNGKRKRIENRRNESMENANESPEEDNGEFEKKLQFYLMDTISPAKKESETKIDTDLIMELPMMTKKSTISKLSNFAKKSQDQQQSESHPQKVHQTPTKTAFAGNLLNLAAPKGEQNPLSISKIKKTSSHMSEYMNKNKSQKPTGFNGTGFKLPGMFNRLGKK